jgi:hypothetical protein
MSYELQKIMINESYHVIDIHAFARRCLYTDQVLQDIEEKSRSKSKQLYQSNESMSQRISVIVIAFITNRTFKFVVSQLHTNKKFALKKEVILIMSSCNLKDDLFDDDSVIESCILDDENQYLVKAMIDNDCIDYSFVNSIIVRSIWETLKISSMKLNKSRKIKRYDERMSDSITHVIYSRMIIKDHVESSIFLLITKLN